MSVRRLTYVSFASRTPTTKGSLTGSPVISITPLVGSRGNTRSPSSSKNRTVASTFASSRMSVASLTFRSVSSAGTRKLNVSVVNEFPKESLTCAFHWFGPPTSVPYGTDTDPLAVSVCAVLIFAPVPSWNWTVTVSVDGKLASSMVTPIETGPDERSVLSAGVMFVTTGAGSSSVMVWSGLVLVAAYLSVASTYQANWPLLVRFTVSVTVEAEVIVWVLPICESSAAR